ncbi:hypothetical protein [Arthrobacter silviterrae]|uniref:Tetratricopeptide repeat protein n=1 Tax=Arthrobacter silviterrae TaxID=2026658 RepID=A0ABX0D8J2_9MICC|nr:hypothetical protein [Arthrobacter silviterrae]NGN83203.1 hypothetical protein [Arthrobacter silviterrae]
MAEHQGGNRDGNSRGSNGGGFNGGQGRGGSGDRSYGDRKPFGDRDNRGGQGGRPYGNRDDRPARSGGDRPYGDRPARSNDRPYGDRKPFGDRDNRGGQGGQGGRPYGDRDARPSYGNRDDRPARSGGDRPYGDRDARPSYGNRDDRPARSGGDRPYGDRDSRGGQGGRPYGDRDARPSYGNRDDRPARSGGDRPYGDRPARSNDRPYGDRKPFGDRDNRGGQGGRPYGDRDARPSYGNRDDRPARSGGDRPYGDRPARSNDRPYGDRDNRGGQGGRPYGDRDARPSYGNRDARPSYGNRDDRPARSGGDRPYGDRKPFGDRDNRGADRPMVNGRREDRKPFGDRDNRGGQGGRPYGDRPARSNDRPYGDRNDRPGHESRPAHDRRDDRGPRQAPPRNAADLRSSNRPDRERSPEIDSDVTGEELDKVTRAQLRILDTRNNEWVSKHLVMAGRLIDFDPELAFRHALAASRRGGRLACVREAVAMTAYAAGNYGEALRELRTYRRISGSNAHLPLMADCERGLGRPDRALDLIKSEDAESLDVAGKVELAIVESGARGDLGELDAALSALELPQLDINRAFSFSPRLFRAYGMVLRALDRKDEAKKWERQALVAEEALGIDDSMDSIIVDLGADDDEDGVELRPRTRVADVMDGAEPADGVPGAEADAPANQHDEVESDDAESDAFESDDAESDQDSIDDELDRAEMGGSGDEELDALLDGDGDDAGTFDHHDGEPRNEG